MYPFLYIKSFYELSYNCVVAYNPNTEETCLVSSVLTFTSQLSKCFLTSMSVLTAIQEQYLGHYVTWELAMSCMVSTVSVDYSIKVRPLKCIVIVLIEDSDRHTLVLCCWVS